MSPPLTKILVAKRQLATAIELFFAGGDSISVYSLATNAWEIIDVLCRKVSVNSISIQARESLPSEKDLKLDYINSPYRNFFKHAKSDSDQALSPLPNSQVEAVLFLAVEDYIRLQQRSPVQLQVFQLWYLAKHPEKLATDVKDELTEGIRCVFPDLPSLSRDEQLAQGALMLTQALQDFGLLNDPRTEAAFE